MDGLHNERKQIPWKTIPALYTDLQQGYKNNGSDMAFLDESLELNTIECR